MKKIFLLTILLLSSLSQAADFTISIQPAGGAAKKWRIKFNNQIIAEEAKTKSLQSFYFTNYGSILSVNANTNKISLTGDQVWFESFDCTGTPHIGALNPVVMTHRGIILRPINNIAQSNKPFNSRLSNFAGEACSQFSTTINTSFAMQICSLQDCPFAANSDIIFEEN